MALIINWTNRFNLFIEVLLLRYVKDLKGKEVRTISYSSEIIGFEL
jgi:hypothetical protein|tara:strand:+ start:687 stop:824 length:138 start_codon:yes stop_codon:yes gene_type:complete